MWEKQHSTVETGNGDQVGTMSAYSCEKSPLKVEVVLDWSMMRLRLQVTNGEFEYSSEWLECTTLLPPPAMDQYLHKVRRLWQARYTLPSSAPTSGLTPLELTIAVWRDLDTILA